MNVAELAEKLDVLVKQGKGSYKIQYADENSEIEVDEISEYDGEKAICLW